MLAELVFLTRFLGLASGEPEIVLRANDEVHRVEILRDGERLARIAGPPWRARVELGKELGPYELTAVGYGADGAEVARVSQFVNIALPEAEAGLLLARGQKGLTARLAWWHVDGFAPVSATLKLDGKIITRKATSRTEVSLGNVADADMHVLSAELRFRDGKQVRKEIAFGGIYSEQMPAELTSVGLRRRSAPPPSPPPCFQMRGRGDEVAPVAIEEGSALVLFVLNGTAPTWAFNGTPMWEYEDRTKGRRVYRLTAVEISVVSPVLQKRRGAESFPRQRVPSQSGTLDVIKLEPMIFGEQQFAHAIATSAMHLIRSDRRRAIVYVLGDEPAVDQSAIDPAVVRRYARRVGVPLHIWSLTGPRPDLESTWGPVTDASTALKLAEATNRLREDLATQRIAWFAGPPLDAYRATASADCAYSPLATNDPQ